MIIKLNDFNKNMGFYLDDIFREQLFKTAKNKTNLTWKDLAGRLNITYNYLVDIRKGRHFIPLTILLKIAHLVEIPFQDIERNILMIRSGGSKLPVHLPIKISKKLVGLVAHGFGDGHIDKKFNFHYCNGDAELQKKVLRDIRKIFGSIPFYDRFSSYKVPVKVYPFLVGHVLHILGVPRGNKTLQNYNLPEWILKRGKGYKKVFLRELFTDEGGVRKDVERKSNRSITLAFSRIIEYKRSLKSFLENIRRMLLEFGIETSPVSEMRRYKDKKGREKIVLGFDVRGLKDLCLFKSEIGFSSNSKISDLDLILKSFKFDPQKSTSNLILTKLKESTCAKTAKELAKEIGKAYSTVRKYLCKLHKDGKIRLVKQIDRKKYWSV